MMSRTSVISPRLTHNLEPLDTLHSLFICDDSCCVRVRVFLLRPFAWSSLSFYSKCTQHRPLPMSPSDDSGGLKRRTGQQFCVSCFVKGKPTKIQLCDYCGAYHTTHNFGRESAQCLQNAQARGGKFGLSDAAPAGFSSPPSPHVVPALESSSSSSATTSSASSSSSSSSNDESDPEFGDEWPLLLHHPPPPTRRPSSVTRQTTVEKVEALLALAYSSAGAASALASPSLEHSSTTATSSAAEECAVASSYHSQNQPPLGIVASPPAVAALGMLAGRARGKQGRPFYYRPPSQTASDAEVVSSLLALAATNNQLHDKNSLNESPKAAHCSSPVLLAAPEARPGGGEGLRADACGRSAAGNKEMGVMSSFSLENQPGITKLSQSRSPSRHRADEMSFRSHKRIRTALSPYDGPTLPSLYTSDENCGAATKSAFYLFKQTTSA